MLLVGRQEGHLACKNWVVRYGHGYLSGASIMCRVDIIPQLNQSVEWHRCFTDQMPFLLLNRQCQSSQGNLNHWPRPGQITHCLVPSWSTSGLLREEECQSLCAGCPTWYPVLGSCPAKVFQKESTLHVHMSEFSETSHCCVHVCMSQIIIQNSQSASSHSALNI